MKMKKNTSLSLSSRSTNLNTTLKSNIVPKQYTSTTEISDHPIARPEFSSYTELSIPAISSTK